jgi:voltage-gated potassium channel
MQSCQEPASRRLRLATEYERLTRPALGALGVAFLGTYAWPILNPGMPAFWRATLSDIGLAIWLCFAVDYLVRLIMATDRAGFVRRNWFDLIVIMVPMVRPLRAVRGLMGLRAVARGGLSIRRRDTVVSLAVAMIAGGAVAALAMLQAERPNPGANIRTFGDSLWWAFTTMATVGYGDRYPTTAEGRLVAAALMVGGVALLGVVTAALASWFVERFGRAQRSDTELLQALHQLRTEVAELRAELHEGARRVDVTVSGAP